MIRAEIEPNRRTRGRFRRLLRDERRRRSRASTGSRRSGRPTGTPTARTGSTGRRRATEVYSIDTPPPTVSGSLHMGSCSRTCRPTPSPASSACAGSRSSTRWAGTTTGVPTERRVQNYYGVRCDPSLPYDPAFAPPEKPRQAGAPDHPPELRRAVRPAHGRGRAEVRGAVAHARPVGRLVDDLHHDRRAGPPGVAARVPAEPRARRGVPVGGADALGRRLPHGGRAGRARGPRAARRVPRGALRRHRRRRRHRDRDDTARADPRVRGAGRAPRRRALLAALRTRGHHAAVRRAGAGARAPARRSREGVGHRDDLHLRRHHRRHVVARAAAPDPHRHRAGRPAAARAARLGHAPRRRPRRATRSSRARRSSRRRRASSSCSPSPATWSASRSRSPTR